MQPIHQRNDGIGRALFPRLISTALYRLTPDIVHGLAMLQSRHQDIQLRLHAFLKWTLAPWG